MPVRWRIQASEVSSRLRQLVVGDDPLREIAAATGDLRAQDHHRRGHHAAPAARAGDRVEARQLVADLLQEAVHLRSTATPIALAKPNASVRAVALDRNAAETEEHRAVIAARVEPRRQFLQGAAGKQIADAAPTANAGTRRAANSLNSLAVPFDRLQRDVAGKAVGDDHVDRARGDVVALDKAVEADRRSCRRAAGRWPRAHRVVALEILRADIEQADGRLRPARARCGRRRRPSARTARGSRRRIRHWRRGRA